MRHLMRFGVTVLAAVGIAAVMICVARAEEVTGAPAATSTTQQVFGATGAVSGRRVESVLSNPRAAVTAAKPGTGWLLHSGTPQRDTCDNADATYGLRVLCVGW